MRAVRAVVLAACLLTLPVLDASPAHAAPTLWAGAFTGGGSTPGCVSPGPCTILGWSALCQMTRVGSTVALEPCSMTLSGVVDTVGGVSGSICTGFGNGTVVIRNSGGSIVASIPVGLAAVGGDVVWAGLNAGVTPPFVNTSEGAIHLACGFAVGSLAGAFVAGHEV